MYLKCSKFSRVSLLESGYDYDNLSSFPCVKCVSFLDSGDYYRLFRVYSVRPRLSSLDMIMISYILFRVYSM